MKKTEMIGFKTTTEIRQRLEEIAKEDDRSLSYIINQIMKQYLQKGENNMTIKEFATKIIANIELLEDQNDMSKEEMLRNIKANIADEAELE